MARLQLQSKQDGIHYSQKIHLTIQITISAFNNVVSVYFLRAILFEFSLNVFTKFPEFRQSL